MNHRRIAALLLAAALLLTALPALSEAPAEKALTLMVYMCGSELESRYGCASADIDELLCSGIDTDRVNVLVMTGGARNWATGQAADTLQICGLRRGQLIAEYSGPARSMGEADTLSFFLNYAKEKHPAEAFALVLWGPGSGLSISFGYDELFDGDGLTLTELDAAFGDSPFSGGQRLAWVLIDATGLACLEMATCLSPYAEYMIGTQLAMPASGLDYTALGSLGEGLDGAEVGRRVIDAFFEQAQSDGHPSSLSCLGLNGVAGVNDALLSLQNAVERREESQPAFGDCLEACRVEGDETVFLYDLYALSERCAGYAPEESSALKDALSGSVVYARSSTDDARGLSARHPSMD